jgi:UDP-GlcNAc3NAcA epimerase
MDAKAGRRLLNMHKIITILGARPQFVKAAVVSRAIDQYNKGATGKQIKEQIVHTGQHFDLNMSDVFFQEMSIPEPAHYLNINSMTHGAMTGQMLEAVESLLVKESPDLVLVYGDTNSTLAGALAAVKLHIPIAHVEAGLRSYNRLMPEEHNRVLTDHLSSFLFCPTAQSVTNLKHEGFVHYPAANSAEAIPGMAPRIFQVGDVMYDAALYYSRQAPSQASFAKQVIKERLHGQRFALVTVHRQENTDHQATLDAILSALIKLSENIPVVWPMHPRTRKVLDAQTANAKLDRANLITIDPVGYFDMIEFLKNCAVVLTDSGGLQKEAYFFQKPCVTLRSETEWVELVDHGYNQVVGTDPERIINAVSHMREASLNFDQILYGSGKAGAEIVSIIANAL